MRRPTNPKKLAIFLAFLALPTCCFTSIGLQGAFSRAIGFLAAVLALGAGVYLFVYGYKSPGRVRRKTSTEPEIDTRIPGQRVRLLRRELGLKPPLFARLLGLRDEKALKRLEKQKRALDSAFAKQLSSLSGVNLAWLENGEGNRRFAVDRLTPFTAGDFVASIQTMAAEKMIITLAADQLSVGVLIQTDAYSYSTHDLGLSLNFWDEDQAGWEVAQIRTILKDLLGMHIAVEGSLIPAKYARQLFSGEIHPLAAKRQARQHSQDWLRHYLDFNYRLMGRSDYRTRYGLWFTRSQDELKAAD